MQLMILGEEEEEEEADLPRLGSILGAVWLKGARLQSSLGMSLSARVVSKELM